MSQPRLRPRLSRVDPPSRHVESRLPATRGTERQQPSTARMPVRLDNRRRRRHRFSGVRDWIATGALRGSWTALPNERTLAYAIYDRPAREGASFDQMFSSLYEGAGWVHGSEAANARYYYPLLQKAFESAHGEVAHRFFATGIAAGSVLTANDELFVEFWWNGFYFDTCPARVALTRLLDLRDEAQRYLDQASGRRKVFLEKLFTTASDLIVAVRNERDRNPQQVRRDEPNAPSRQYVADIAQLEGRLDELKTELESQASQPATIRYSFGVLLGLAVICAAGAVAAVSGARGVGLGVTIGGAVGSFVSVSLRLSGGTPVVDYRADSFTQVLFGVLRPLVGCAFAWAIYAIVAGGLGSYIKAPTDETTRTLFYAALGFISGFSERFAQDVIVKTSGGMVKS